MADKKADPMITASTDAPAYPEGTHPALPASEVTHSATNIKYADATDKPDVTTVAQVEVE